MLNSVRLIGHLGADPEVHTFQDGGKVANLRLATTEKWRDRATSEIRERTEWHRVTVRGAQVDALARYLAKGSRVHIDGKLVTRKWQDQSGADRFTTEVVAHPFGGVLFLDRPNHTGGSGAGASASSAASGPPIEDDEIPF